MEGLYVVACGASMAAVAAVATGGGASRHAQGWSVRAAGRVVNAWCAWVGSARLLTLLQGIPSWRAASEGLARRSRRWGGYLARGEAGALLLTGLVCLWVLAGLLSRSVLGCCVGVVLTCIGIPLWHSSRQRARERALIDEMPEVFRTLAMALGAGETLMQAIEYVGMHERGYAGEAFVQAALRLRCGASAEEAMDALGRELDAPGVGMLTTALVIAQRTGSPLRGLFQSSAQIVERQGEFERLLAVKTAQVRLSVRIVCLLPLLLVCLLSLISVDYQQGLSTLPGMVCVLVASVMDGLALLIIRRLMRGVL